MFKSVIKHLGVAKSSARDLKTESPSPKRSRDELDFLPSHLELLERPPSRAGRLFALGIIAVIGFALTWAALGRIDVVASAPGKLIVSEYSKTIQASETGIIGAIHVTDGQKVQKGDVLVALRTVSAGADEDRLRQQITYSKLTVARLSALLQDNPAQALARPEGVAETDFYETRMDLIREYEEQQARQQTQKARINENAARQQATRVMIRENRAMRENIQKRFDARSTLQAQGYVSPVQLSELELELMRFGSELKNEMSKLDILRAEANTLTREQAQQQAEWRKSIREALRNERQRLVDLTQEQIKAEDRSQLHTITAPVSGIVQQIKANASNGVVSQGQELMTLVPDNVELLAEISLLNKDVGFVLAGQEVEVKIDSFPYTKYGTVKAQVRNVSRDSMLDERLGLVFPTYLTLETEQITTTDEIIDLTSGMSITAEIKTGDRRILSYILSPLQEYQSEALRER